MLWWHLPFHLATSAHRNVAIRSCDGGVTGLVSRPKAIGRGVRCAWSAPVRRVDKKTLRFMVRPVKRI